MSEAVFGLIGVIVGSLLTWVKEGWLESRSRTRQARYLAVRVVCALDDFFERCVEVVQDHGSPDGQGCIAADVREPSGPALPNDVDWKSIDHDLMYELLVLPSETEYADRVISFVASEVSCPPDYSEFFEERRLQFSKLGIKAAALADRLRSQYEIPERSMGEWDPRLELKKKIEAIERRRGREDRDGAVV